MRNTESTRVSRIRNAWNAASFYPHLWRKTPVKLIEAPGSKALHLAERRRCIGEQHAHVGALAAGNERREVSRPARKHVYGAEMIQLAQVMDGHADLQDALVQIPDVAALAA